MHSISILVPVYNAQSRLIALCDALLQSCSHLDDLEIIFIDDCSQDDSWCILTELEALYTQVKCFQLAKNYGQHNALLCGIRNAKNDIIVTLDDDFQNPPSEIPKLVAALDQHTDVVYGRPAKQQHGFLRNIASQLTKHVLKRYMGSETAQHISAFRAFRTHLREAFIDVTGTNVNLDVLLTWGTGRFTHVQVAHNSREEASSGYTAGKLITHAFNMITGFTTVPLQAISILGIGVGLCGGVSLVYILLMYILQGNVVTGFPFLAAIISIFSGTQLIALGIFGEYIGRIHSRTMAKPAYVIRPRKPAKSQTESE